MLSLFSAVLLLLLGSQASSIPPRVKRPEATQTLQDLPWKCISSDAGIKSTNWRHCSNLASELAQIASPRQKLLFSTQDPRIHPAVDYQIPITFYYDSCWATIGPIQERADVQDLFTSRYLSRTILDMAHQCVAPPPHLGGMGEIGARKVLALALSGPKSSPDAIFNLGSNMTRVRMPDSQFLT